MPLESVKRAGSQTGGRSAISSGRIRRTLGRALAELHDHLRRSTLTRSSIALSIGLGTAVGCLPLYGLHLGLCLGLARVFGLSGGVAYLAAHINNPWTAPLLLYVEFGTGHWLSTGKWPELSIDAVTSSSLLELGGHLLVGSLMAAGLLAVVLGAAAFAAVRRVPERSFEARLRDATADRYLEAGRSTWELVRGKLHYDPVYLAVLERGALAVGCRLLDLGCGRGILLALRCGAAELAASGEWPDGWPCLHPGQELRGIEVDESRARTAAAALRGEARIEVGDLRSVPLPPTDVAVLIDVLHYLSREEQERLLERAVGALAPGGRLLIREADAAAGLRFELTALQERACALVRLEGRRAFSYRSAAEWRSLLEALGLRTHVVPMSTGTPFANVLLEGCKPPA